MQIERMRHERVSLSKSARKLLCDFAAVDAQRPLSRLDDVDWTEVFRGVCRNGLLGLTHRYLKQHEAEDYPPQEFRAWVHQAIRLDALNTALMYRNIGQVLSHLTQSGLDYMVVKGPAVAYTAYPEPNLRSFNDLDLVVRERDWAVTHRLLVEMGFYQERQEGEKELKQPPPKFAPPAMLHELSYWQPQMSLCVEVHYDDLLNAGLASRDVEGFWQRAIFIEVEGVPVKIMSLEDQLVHLCMHIHYHGYTRLNALSEIALIIRDQAAQLNWERLLETARIEEAQVGVYYTLYFLEQLLGLSAPAEVLAALRPDRFRRWWHEYYMPREKVLSLQPMWRPDFSFYFMPLLKRLLPDLLVMGRRGEKLRCLWRLLLPPPAWLRYYYQLDDNQNVAIHYLLHPLKLMYHYLDEVMVTLFGYAPDPASTQNDVISVLKSGQPLPD